MACCGCLLRVDGPASQASRSAEMGVDIVMDKGNSDHGLIVVQITIRGAEIEVILHVEVSDEYIL